MYAQRKQSYYIEQVLVYSYFSLYLRVYLFLKLLMATPFCPILFSEIVLYIFVNTVRPFCYILHSILGSSNLLRLSLLFKNLHILRFTICAVKFYEVQQMYNGLYPPLKQHIQQFHSFLGMVSTLGNWRQEICSI